MSKIKFHRLSICEAEEVVVDIWKCLEEYDFPVPRLTFDFHDAATVSIVLEVEEPVSAVIMNWRMSSWVDAGSYGTDPTQNTRKQPCAHGHPLGVQPTTLLEMHVAAAAPYRHWPRARARDFAWPAKRR
jgi:hypothetical protein